MLRYSIRSWKQVCLFQSPSQNVKTYCKYAKPCLLTLILTLPSYCIPETDSRPRDKCCLCLSHVPKKAKAYLFCCRKPLHISCWNKFLCKSETEIASRCPHCRQQPYGIAIIPSPRQYCCRQWGCTSTFLHKQNLKNHEEYGHIFCHACNRQISRQKWQSHYRQHPETKRVKPFRCTVCNARYKNSLNLRTHVLEEHLYSISFKPVTKTYIKLISAQSEQLYVYATGEFNILKISAEQRIEVLNKDAAYQPYNCYQCACCLGTFNDINVLIEHLINNHSMQTLN